MFRFASETMLKLSKAKDELNILNTYTVYDYVEHVSTHYSVAIYSSYSIYIQFMSQQSQPPSQSQFENVRIEGASGRPEEPRAEAPRPVEEECSQCGAGTSPRCVSFCFNDFFPLKKVCCMFFLF